MSEPRSTARVRFRSGIAYLSLIALLLPGAAFAAPPLVQRTTQTPVTTVTSEQLENLPSNRDLKTILDYHNQLRADVGSPPLRWNPDLAAGAAAYGPVISQGGTLRHASRGGRKTIRENLLQSPRGIYSPLEMVQVWGAEKQYFSPGIFPNVSTNGDWASVGHYTQMIWPTTTDLGCAIYPDPKYEWLICRYSPPGNRDGSPIGVPPTIIAENPAINVQSASLPLDDCQIADTFTVGAIIQPRFLPRLAITIDFYDLAIDDAIGRIGSSPIGEAQRPLSGNSAKYSLPGYNVWDSSMFWEPDWVSLTLAAKDVFNSCRN